MRRVVLRAEIRSGGAEGREISHTQVLSEESVVVQADEPLPIGADVALELSLRGLVLPLSLTGEVVAHSGSGEPGDPALMTIRLRLESEEERRRLRELLQRLDDEERAPLPASYRVLIVDDNRLVRDLFSYGVTRYFRSRGGVEVDVVGDGLAAWALVQERRYDLALIDQYLPVLDGAGLVERLRGLESSSEMLVVAISGGGAEARRIMVNAGADLFLAKPVVLRDLFATLDRLTETEPKREDVDGSGSGRRKAGLQTGAHPR